MNILQNRGQETVGEDLGIPILGVQGKKAFGRHRQNDVLVLTALHLRKVSFLLCAAVPVFI